jgi:hypothetical protein
MNEGEALDFYQRITEGKKQYDEIKLEHNSGAMLEDVQMHPVDKRVLASVIEKLPQEMFEAVEDADNPEDAEEQIEAEGGSLDAISEDTVEAFEKLCERSLSHPELTKPQMETIVAELDFDVLFELGTEIIDMSSENAGAVRGFQRQG